MMRSTNDRIDRWATVISPKSRARGQAYFRNNRVSIEREDATSYLMIVEGDTDRYAVEIAADLEPFEAECSCPHFSEGHFCKHIWAALLSIESHSHDEDDADEDLETEDDAAPWRWRLHQIEADARAEELRPKSRKTRAGQAVTISLA